MQTPIAGFYSNLVSLATWLSSVHSFQVWRDILNPGKMMNGETLMILLKWTIYGFSGENK